ncbi:single-stranded-DNA-specific exonuclease RecJ [Scatolibacter rhodanostii]|uniref:single-stranded-DNA-specific exonuclease RecJ n=1 Tax=Scatolibacter rhodanostii TaxID=2014781 RepID=UPI0013563264|nr:single-stranded-DNA-specific exonuclease RecJ [Scatolibacter rhodanostii]
MNLKQWKVASLNKQRAAEIAERFAIPDFLAMMLDIRGFTTDEAIEDIFSSEYYLSDPFLIKDMDKAVKRIQAAIDSFEKIAVYGDYDTDGVTATAILFTYLDTVGANVMYYIPQRESEGYGMNKDAVRFLHESGVNLIVTVDNGIASIEEVDLANELGMDVVITDHHRQHAVLPNAVAVVDLHRHDCDVPFKDLCGAGLALKLLMALEGGDEDMILAEYADLAALGTIADVMPLTGENRVIVKAGLEVLQNGGKPGLEALIRQSGSSDRELTAKMLAFTIIPRLNATGRMSSSEKAVKLLTCDYEEEAEILASDICEENTSRRSIEADIAKAAMAEIESNADLVTDRVLVVSGENWHAGIIGIVASKITDHFGKPCIVITKQGEIAKGSGRSVEGFSLFEAITSCAELFEKFGGHPMAVGITLKTENIEALRIKINTYAQNAYHIMPSQKVHLDCKLNPAFVSAGMPEQLKQLEPFGAANAEPVFGFYKMEIEKIIPVGGGAHLRLQCTRNGSAITCMCFSTTETAFLYEVGDIVDLAVSLDAKEYKGQMQLTIIVKDIKPSHLDLDTNIQSYRMYERFTREEKLSAEEAQMITPSREELGDVYRKITAKNGLTVGLLSLTAGFAKPTMTLGKLLICLTVLNERKLAECQLLNEQVQLSLLPTSGNKINIYDSAVFSKIKDLIE